MVGLQIVGPGREFRQVMEEFVRRSHSGLTKAMNARALDVVIKAYQHTRTADRQKIEHALGVTSYDVGRQLKSGKVKRYKRARASLSGSPEKSMAYRIIQKRYFAVQGRYLPVAIAQDKALKLIRAVLRSVGFIRSGWVPGLRRLNAAVGKGGFSEDAAARQFGQPKGYAHVASDSSLMIEVANTTKVAAPIAGPALERAIAESQAWMEQKMMEDQEKIAQSMARTIS